MILKHTLNWPCTYSLLNTHKHILTHTHMLLICSTLYTPPHSPVLYLSTHNIPLHHPDLPSLPTTTYIEHTAPHSHKPLPSSLYKKININTVLHPCHIYAMLVKYLIVSLLKYGIQRFPAICCWNPIKFLHFWLHWKCIRFPLASLSECQWTRIWWGWGDVSWTVYICCF